MVGRGSAVQALTEAETAELMAEACAEMDVDRRRVLVLIPDGTRHAPIPLMFRLLGEHLGARAARLDYLIALGTHPPMAPDAIDRLVGMPAERRRELFPNVEVVNHAWDRPEALRTMGVISGAEVDRLTEGLICEDVPVTLNRLILEYDLVLICGPVFPHEVAGFSGGAKYLFPGIAGAEIINATHWLGALVTSMATIGVKDTAVRRVIHRAAELVPTRIHCIAQTVSDGRLHGLWAGDHLETWSAAADLSSQLEIIRVPRPFRSVLALASPIYDDLWTGAKAMYKSEPVVADGGEVIIYAPHLSEISYTHGGLIDEVGYHVRDYFVKQPGRFDSVPGMIKAHSTHVKGAGTYDAETGVEEPRISVTLATSIPEERCRRVSLGYADYRSIDMSAWEGREAEGLLLIRDAGEKLYQTVDRAG